MKPMGALLLDRSLGTTVVLYVLQLWGPATGVCELVSADMASGCPVVLLLAGCVLLRLASLVCGQWGAGAWAGSPT